MYPIHEPYKTFMLKVDHIKDINISIYVELCGNPNGIPVIYLHGGPGDYITSHLRQIYNPSSYNLILFDQRGCGKSLPRNHIEKNTTQLLIHDIESIRKTLGIKQMIVTGGSWGTSLAVLYAESHPRRVIALVLRGLFDLIGNDDVLQSMDPVNNDKIKKLLNLNNSVTGKAGNKREFKILHSTRKNRHKLIELLADDDSMYVLDKKLHNDTFKDKETLAIIGNHYEVNNYFVKKNQMMKNLYKIKDIPIIVISGKYDIITPPYMAYEFCKKVKCSLRFIRGGHTYWEKNIGNALVEEMDKLEKQFKCKADTFYI